MKSLLDPSVARYRRVHPRRGESATPHLDGYFVLPYRGANLRVIVSKGMMDDASEGWDHVSVSLATRCPRWDEMCFVKDVFFEKHEMCVQYHPAQVDYVNNHSFCLHIWRHVSLEIPKPPAVLVGDARLGVLS